MILRRSSCIVALLFILTSFWATARPSGGEPAAPRPRLNPAGLEGSLILCGDGETSASAVQRFLELAGGKTARVVIVRLGLKRPSPAVLLKGTLAALVLS